MDKQKQDYSYLEKLLFTLNNYFEDKIITGTFLIEDGHLLLNTKIEDGQFVRIVGSVHNDGIYKHPYNSLIDEQFDGGVWLLKVPPQVLKLAEDIQEWKTKNKDIIDSPFKSESFGGYSYSKDSASTSAEQTFAKELNKWRKL